jgi:hypothetical protein
MKTALTLALTTASLLASSQSFAFGVNIAQCESKDGRLEISIVDMQGTGRGREANPVAALRDARSGKVLESYSVEMKYSAAIGSGLKWADTNTAGALFLLSGPGSRAKGYNLSAILPDGSHVDEAVNCSVFGRDAAEE